MGVSVIGTFHSKFGKSEQSVYELLVEAGKSVLVDAKVPAKLIGGIWVGNYSGGGFNHQEHLAPFAINIDTDLRFVPTNRLENACASGFAAIQAAYTSIMAGEVDYALVIGVEKMTSLNTKGVTDVLSMASYYPEEGAEGLTFPGLFAEFGKGYMEKHNISEEELARGLRKIASKNYRNALSNPYAQMPRDMSDEDIANLPQEKNPMVAYPLKLHDCSLVSDGAAAIILTKTDIAKNRNLPFVEILGMEQTTDYLQMSKRETYKFTGAAEAVKKIFNKTGLTLKDIDFAEVHDCFTIAELLIYEALGLCDEGKALELLEQGYTNVDGKFPVNASGGLKAKGHPVGATGVSMTVATVRQLLGNPVGAKVDSPKKGMIVNLGGSAVNSYVAILGLPE